MSAFDRAWSVLKNYPLGEGADLERMRSDYMREDALRGQQREEDAKTRYDEVYEELHDFNEGFDSLEGLRLGPTIPFDSKEHFKGRGDFRDAAKYYGADIPSTFGIRHYGKTGADLTDEENQQMNQEIRNMLMEAYKRKDPSAIEGMYQELEESQDEARRLNQKLSAYEKGLGPMNRQMKFDEAQQKLAEGVDLPDGPRVSAVPPASVGRAGSIMGEGRPNLRELYFGSNNQTPAAKNEFITADDFMRPPVQKSFDKAWALLKGQYMHPSVMGHFARGQMVREADGPLATEYAFDDHGDPANRPERFSGTEEDRRFNRQEKIARDLGFETAAEMREESFRPRVREQASSIPQELVDAMIAEMKNPQLEGEEGYNYLSQRDDNRMTNLLAARQTNPSETQIEQLARDVRPANNPRVDVSRGI